MKDTLTLIEDIDWGSFMITPRFDKSFYGQFMDNKLQSVTSGGSMYGDTITTHTIHPVQGNSYYSYATIDNSNSLTSSTGTLRYQEPKPVKKKRSLNSVIAHYYARKQKG